MFSFLANKETEHTDPILFSRNHGPEAIPQTRRIAHGTRRSVPRFVDGVHIPDSDVDKVVQGRVVKRHVVGTTIKLVLMEGYQASVVNQVVQRQPLLQDIMEVLFWVLRPKKGGIDKL